MSHTIFELLYQPAMIRQLADYANSMWQIKNKKYTHEK